MAEAQTVERLIVALEARTKEYEKALAKAQATTVSKMRAIEREVSRSQARMGNALSKTGSFIGRQFGLSLGVLTAGALISGLRNIVAELGNIADNATKAGVAIEDFQKVLASAVQEGVGQDQLARAFAIFNKQVAEARVKSNDLAKILAHYNVTLGTDTVENFYKVIDLINRANNEQDQMVIGAAAFKKSYIDLAPLIDRGAEAIKKTGEEAQKAGQIFDAELVQGADKFDEAWTYAIFKMKRNAVVAAVAIAEAFVKAIQAIRAEADEQQRSAQSRYVGSRGGLTPFGSQIIKTGVEQTRPPGASTPYSPAVYAQQVAQSTKSDKLPALPAGLLGGGGGGGGGGGKISDEMIAERKRLAEANKELLETEREMLENLQPLQDAFKGIFADLRNGVSVIDAVTNALNNLADQLANMAIDKLFSVLAASLTRSPTPFGSLTYGGPRA